MMELFRKHRVLTTKFVIVGGIGFIVNYAVLKIFTQMGANSVIAEILAVLVALQVTFLLHDNWTYRLHKQKNHQFKLSTRYFSYLTSNSLGALITVTLFSFFSIFLHHFFALVVASMFSMIWNFFMNKVIVWRQKVVG
jgi:putative flippase GtrA